MSSREIFYNSFVISLPINFFKWYVYINKRISYIYLNSKVSKILFKSKEKIKIYAMNCFMVKITEFQEIDISIFKSSNVLRYLIIFFTELKSKLRRYFSLSLTGIVLKFILLRLNSFFFKIICLFFFIVIMCNIVEYGFFYRQIDIGVCGWLMRGLFLFINVSGLFSKTNWSDIKLNSIFLKKLGSIRYDK